MTDFSDLSKKIFLADDRIRGVTFSRFDGGITHFEMRAGIDTLNPPGIIGKKDAEVFVPVVGSYFDEHKKYFGEVEYMVTKFEKVSIVYVRHNSTFLIMSVEPKIDIYPIVQKVKKILEQEVRSGQSS